MYVLLQIWRPQLYAICQVGSNVWIVQHPETVWIQLTKMSLVSPRTDIAFLEALAHCWTTFKSLLIIISRSRTSEISSHVHILSPCWIVYLVLKCCPICITLHWIGFRDVTLGLFYHSNIHSFALFEFEQSVWSLDNIHSIKHKKKYIHSGLCD